MVCCNSPLQKVSRHLNFQGSSTLPKVLGGSVMTLESCRGVDGLEKVTLLKYGYFWVSILDFWICRMYYQKLILRIKHPQMPKKTARKTIAALRDCESTCSGHLVSYRSRNQTLIEDSQNKSVIHG